MLQKGYNAIKNPKQERNTEWYNNRLHEIGMAYSNYIQSIQPFEGFDDLNVMDTWSIKKMTLLSERSRKIEDDTRRIANKIESVIEDAKQEKGVGVLSFQIRVFNKDMLFETKRFEGTPETLLGYEDEQDKNTGEIESSLMNMLLGFETHRTMMDGPSWYERHLINLFDLVAIFRKNLKPFPNFKHISALQEWSFEKVSPVQNLKDKIEKQTERSRKKISDLLALASRKGIKSLDFRVQVVPSRGQQKNLHFKGPPKNLVSENYGEMIDDVLVNVDTYSFLQDHSEAKKELNKNSSILFGGDDGVLIERTKSEGAPRHEAQ